MGRKISSEHLVEYGFECAKCDIIFLKEGDRRKSVPKKCKCPKCGKFTSDRHFFPVNLEFRGRGFQTTDTRVQNFYEKGYDEQQAKEFYNNAIKYSQERQKQGGQHYERMHLDIDYAVNNGMAKPISKEKAKEKYERAKKLRNQTGIDKIYDKK